MVKYLIDLEMRTANVEAALNHLKSLGSSISSQLSLPQLRVPDFEPESIARARGELRATLERQAKVAAGVPYGQDLSARQQKIIENAAAKALPYDQDFDKVQKRRLADLETVARREAAANYTSLERNIGYLKSYDQTASGLLVARNEALQAEQRAKRRVQAANERAATAAEARARALERLQQQAGSYAEGADTLFPGSPTRGAIPAGANDAVQQAVLQQQLATDRRLVTLGARRAAGLEREAFAANEKRVVEAQLHAATRRLAANSPDLLRARAESVAAERQYNANLRKMYRQVAREQGISPGLLRGDEPGGIGGGIDFRRGFRSVAQYGIPSALSYGALNAMQQGLGAAVSLEREMGLVRAQFNAIFGEEATPKFEAFRGHILAIARDTGIAVEDLTNIGLQLEGAFIDVNNIRDAASASGTLGGQDLVNKQLSDAAKVSQVTGLSAKEITDSLTAASLGFKRSFGDIGDVTVALQDRFGVLAREIIPFLGDIAPVAEEAGFSLEEFATLAAVVQRTSGKSGAALAENFGRIIPQLAKSKAELIELATQNANLNNDEFMRAVVTSDAREIFFQLSREFDNLDKGSQDFIVNLIGSRREANALIAAFQGGDIQATAQQLAGAAGSLDEKFRQISQTLSVQLQRVRETFKQLVVSILNAGLLDGIKDIVSAIATVGGAAASLVQQLAPVLQLLTGIPLKLLLMAEAVRAVTTAVKALAQANLLQQLSGVGAAIAGRYGAGAAASTVAASNIGRFTPSVVGPHSVLPTAGAATAAGGLSASAAVPIAGAAVAVGTILYTDIKSQLAADKQKWEQEYDKAMQGLAAKTSVAALQADYDALQNEDTGKHKDGSWWNGVLGTSVKGIVTHAFKKPRRDPEVQATMDKYRALQTNEVFKVVVDAINNDSKDLLEDIFNNRDVRLDLSAAGVDVKGLYGHPEKLRDILKTAQTDTGKKGDEARQVLQIIQNYNGELGALTRQGAQNFIAETSKTFEESITRYQTGDVDFDAVREAYETSVAGLRKALGVAGSAKPGDVLGGGTPSTGENRVASTKELNELLAKRSKEFFAQQSAHIEALKAQFDAGTLDTGTFLAALREELAAEEETIKTLLSSGNTAAKELAEAANLRKLINKTYADAADSFVDYAQDLLTLQEGTTAGSQAGPNLGIAARLRLLKDPNYSDKSARVKTAREIVDLLQKQREIEADVAETAAERNRILNEERPLPEEVSRILAEGLLDLSPAWQELTRVIAAGMSVISQDAIRDVVMAVVFHKQTKEVALRALNQTRSAIISTMNTINDIGVLESTGIIDQYASVENTLSGLDRVLDEITGVMGSGFNFKAASFGGGGGGGGGGGPSAEELAEEAARAARELLEAWGALFDAMIEGDPVKAAQRELDKANYAIAVAAHDAEILQGEAAKVRANRQIEQAMNDVAQARVDYLLALAEAAGDEVEQARINAQNAQAQLTRAHQLRDVGSAGDADVYAAEAAAVRAAAAERDAVINKQREDAQFLYDMEKITKSQFRQLLVGLLNTAGIPEEIARDLHRQIKQLDDTLKGDTQFNLPTFLKLPTLYEARRITQEAGGSGGGGFGYGAQQVGAGYQDNRNVVITLHVNNGTTQEQMMTLLADVVGTNRVSYGNRMY